MISRNKIKQILSLKTKKGREKEQLFIIEGARCVKSYINSSNLVKEIFMNKDFFKVENPNTITVTYGGTESTNSWKMAKEDVNGTEEWILISLL